MAVTAKPYACPECNTRVIETWDDPRGIKFFFLWCERCEKVIDLRLPDGDYSFAEKKSRRRIHR